jgi:hypothetical protein
MSAKQDLVIGQGKTFSLVLRWESPPIIYKQITKIEQSAPAKVTSVAHGIPNGWRAAVASIKGMTQLNHSGDSPKVSDFHTVTVVDADTLEFNEINALNYKAYESGGVLIYNTPVDLTGYTARLTFRDKIGGASLIDMTTENNRILISPANFTITLQIASADTSILTFNKGVYDLELVSPLGVVTGLIYGSVKLEKEVT